MPYRKTTKTEILERAAAIANRDGLDSLSLKVLAEELQIKAPSLFKYFSGLDEIRKQLMLFGWRQLQERMLLASAGVSGKDAVRAMSLAYYDYAVGNKGIFEAMLWYNSHDSEENKEILASLYQVMNKIGNALALSPEEAVHEIRFFRSFIEGFVLLETHHAFGDPIPAGDSFLYALDKAVELLGKKDGAAKGETEK